MRGTSRERHCAVCDKQVHNLAGMTSREIEELISVSNGGLCARITRQSNGSLVTLDARIRSPRIAGLVASASLVFGAATAYAQSGGIQPDGNAHLTGSVLVPDGSKPVAGATIRLEANGTSVSETKTDEHGEFRISAQPGVYNVVIRQNALFGTRIFAASLHEGEQRLQPLKTHVELANGGTTMMGELVPVITYSPSYVFKHPLRYLKHLFS